MSDEQEERLNGPQEKRLNVAQEKVLRDPASAGPDSTPDLDAEKKPEAGDRTAP